MNSGSHRDGKASSLPTSQSLGLTAVPNPASLSASAIRSDGERESLHACLSQAKTRIFVAC